MSNSLKTGELFASGITPVSGAAPELSACLNAVAELGGEQVPGCRALNIKYSPKTDVASILNDMMKNELITRTQYALANGKAVPFNRKL